MEHGGKNNCARHRSCRPQMRPAHTLQVVISGGVVAICLVLGVIGVLPAKSGPASGSIQDGWFAALSVWDVVGPIVSGVVVDELPDPS